MTQMIPTMNSLPENTRKKVITFLQARVADGIHLSQFAKHAHWNVRGPTFQSIHSLFDKVHEDIESLVDGCAERIAQLGGYVNGTCKAAEDATLMAEYPAGIIDEYEHVEVVAAAVSQFSASIRQDIVTAARLGDGVTADLLTSAAALLDKALWILESHVYPLAGERVVTERLKAPRSLGVTNAPASHP